MAPPEQEGVPAWAVFFFIGIIGIAVFMVITPSKADIALNQSGTALLVAQEARNNGVVAQQHIVDMRNQFNNILTGIALRDHEHDRRLVALENKPAIANKRGTPYYCTSATTTNGVALDCRGPLPGE